MNKHADEQSIPQLNEKPTTREILRAVPFLLKFIFKISPGYFSIWILVLILQAPLFSLTVYSTKQLIDALVSGNLSDAYVWFWVFIVTMAFMAINTTLSDVLDDIIRYRLEYAKEERAIALISSLPFSVLERSEYRVLADAYFRKHYLILNINQWMFWMLFYFASSVGLATVVLFIPWQISGLLAFALLARFIITQFESDWNWGLLDMENREGRRSQYLRNMLTFPFTALSVKAINLHTPFIRKWRGLMSGILRSRINGTWKFSMTWGLVELIYIFSFTYSLYLLVGRVGAGTLTIGALAAFVSAFPMLWGRIGNAMNHFRMLRRDASFIVLIHDFFSLTPERDDGESVSKAPLHLTFDKVWFRYPGSKEDVLRGVSFSFMEGERIALVGLNGAGKSTILKLLMGVFHPTKGRILVNGTDLAEIRPLAWREALSVLGQDIPHFDDTIENQILYGDFDRKKDASRFDMSVQSSGLTDMLPEMKKGIKTHAGKEYAMPKDNAIELSGGQNQIVGIARTLYRDARLYIFDEPTSAVDPEKEERFFNALPEVLGGKGVIFVSHRFSTLRRAQRIIVIDNGRVIEEGSHEELLYKKGRYAELFTLQAKAYQ